MQHLRGQVRQGRGVNEDIPGQYAAFSLREACMLSQAYLDNMNKVALRGPMLPQS